VVAAKLERGLGVVGLKAFLALSNWTGWVKQSKFMSFAELTFKHIVENSARQSLRTFRALYIGDCEVVLVNLREDEGLEASEAHLVIASKPL
jgi:hypothetical protein